LAQVLWEERNLPGSRNPVFLFQDAIATGTRPAQHLDIETGVTADFGVGLGPVTPESTIA
jgi:hypothetical protein